MSAEEVKIEEPVVAEEKKQKKPKPNNKKLRQGTFFRLSQKNAELKLT